MFKQVIIVRKDLKWSKGKLAVHVTHAAIGSLKNADRNIIEKWEKEGSKKVVLKIDDLKQLKKMYKKIKDSKLPVFLVKDAGKTQLKTGTITCLGSGPVEEKKINRITGKLKLL